MTKILENPSDKIISHHIFMFPFTIKSFGNNDDTKKDFFNNVTTSIENAGWELKCFNSNIENDNLNYNEFFYFHEFVRDAIYYTENKGNSHLVKYFSRKVQNGKFKIYIKNKKSYSLELKHISLRIYGTEIGIMVMEIVNKTYDNINDIIKINDFGRRIYPQFLGEKGIPQFLGGIDATKDAFLADRIVMKFDGFESTETFEINKFQKKHLVVADYIQKLLGDDFTTSEDAQSKLDATPKFLYKPIIDDRMYVVCWYGSDIHSKNFQTQTQDGSYCYEKNEIWYRYIFLDGNYPTCQHNGMMYNHIKNSTYPRWLNFGTLYGFSRYSLVCISDSDFGFKIIRQHMRKIYAQMAMLLLVQRASILKFSDQIADISKEIDQIAITNKEEELEEFTRKATKVEKLHAAYIRFVNSLWFTEITAQEQGIEMYEKAVKIMRLKSDMEDLKSKIKELYEFMILSGENISNRQMNTLTILGALFLPLMVVTGFFGMNLFFINNNIIDSILNYMDINTDNFINSELSIYIFSFLLFFLLAFLLFIWMKGYLKRMNAGMIVKHLKYSKLLKGKDKKSKN